jgi:hypothetical protein
VVGVDKAYPTRLQRIEVALGEFRSSNDDLLARHPSNNGAR